MAQKPDLVITAVGGYTWGQIRPFALSLNRSGFRGDKVILAYNVDDFTRECLENRGFDIVPFTPPELTTWGFITKHRFVPLLRFLAKHKKDYRYVIWVDAGDQIFQSNPSDWLDKHAAPPTIIAARECWRIKDEPNWNLPWMKALVPDAEWILDKEILCSGTIAGDSETVYSLISKMYEMVCSNPGQGADQAAMNYILREPLSNFRVHIPEMSEGWTATCTSLFTKDAVLIDPTAVPVFDKDAGLVLTPDGRTPYVLVHQFNRDQYWLERMHEKYRWD